MQLQIIGIPEIDADHLRLEEMVGRIDHACRQRLSDKQVRKLLSDLVAEIQSHFVREQEYMMAHEYPALTVHVAEHEHLVHALQAIERLYASGDLCLDASVVAFLRSWLLDHISTADRAYADFILQGTDKAVTSVGTQR